MPETKTMNKLFVC